MLPGSVADVSPERAYLVMQHMHSQTMLPVQDNDVNLVPSCHDLFQLDSVLLGNCSCAVAAAAAVTHVESSTCTKQQMLSILYRRSDQLVAEAIFAFCASCFAWDITGPPQLDVCLLHDQQY